MKFKISREMLDVFPDAVEYVVVARGINNEIPGKWINDRVDKVAEGIRGQGAGLLNEMRYSEWVKVYERVVELSGLNPKDFAPSHVALTKRILDGKKIPNINPVVNFYNFYSLKYGIPVGGEALEKLCGDLELGLSDGSEKFVEIGGRSVDRLGKNEVVWKDDHSVTCRMWAWRQSERTKLSRSTTDIYFIFDGLKNLEDVGLAAIVKMFAEELEEHFGGKTEIGMLDAEHPVYEFDYQTKDISSVSIEEDLKNMVSGARKKKSKGSKKFMKRKAEPMGFVDELQLRSRLTAAVNEVIVRAGYDESGELQTPQNTEFGDLSSTIALRLAKQLKKQPREIAEEIVDVLKKDQNINNIFSKINIAPNGFINLKMSESFLVSELINALSAGADFGRSDVGKKRVILVESPGWNPNKAPHVGHLLNAFLGKTLFRLFNKIGFEARLDDIDNDKGLPVMQTVWAYIKYGGGAAPENEGMKPDQFVHKFYTIGSTEYKNSDDVKEEVNEVLRRWEAEDPEIRKTWKKIVEWARIGHAMVYEQYGEVKDAYMWHESDVYKAGKEIVMKYLGNGIIEKLPDGAVIARIEEKYGLPDTIVIKSDGTGLYHTQDINLTLQKKKKFNAWRIIWVVAEEQIVHFQRLFAILDALGIMPIENLYHYAYSWVVDKDGSKLSSRDGSELTADELHQRLIGAAVKTLEDRGFSGMDSEKKEIADKVAIGAVKFAYLSKDPFKKIKFDMEKAVSFSGMSGPYIMYAYTRGRSILGKMSEDAAAKEEVASFETLGAKLTDVRMNQLDRELLLKVLQYPGVVLAAANNYMPNILAEYLYELAKSFNNFYENVPVLDAEKDKRLLRCGIIKLTTRVLQDGLGILGIKVLERM